MPELSISTDEVCFIIQKARQFDVKEGLSDLDSGSNASDDGMIDVLEDRADDPVAREIAGAVDGLNVDEQAELVALVWLGRGDGGLEDWDELRAEAARAQNGRTAGYLLGIPLLSDYLEEGLALFGLSCADFEAENLG
ncbi:DUF3775 domain-containing protein [Methylocella sp.]|uniref:DUF3775 domain-containing protein n=1 Tax=Methylocella sp. TaxID=1978226 RepID=UPI003784B2E8